MTVEMPHYVDNASSPPYIYSPETRYIDEAPPEIENPEDTFVGCYYNVLYDLDLRREWQPKYNEWLRGRISGDLAPFPLSPEVLMEFTLTKSDVNGSSARQVEIHFAKNLKEALKSGKSLEESIEIALQATRQKIVGVYDTIIEELQGLQRSAKGKLAERYGKLLDAFTRACDIEQTSEWMIKQIHEVGYSEELLDRFINIGQPDNYRNMEHLNRPSDLWSFRKEAVMETLSSAGKYAGEAPHFFALQEVTPKILVDLKDRFTEMQWFSFNNLTGKETTLISPEDETVLGERTAMTATLALSSDWKVNEVRKCWLSETPDQPSSLEKGPARLVLGVVATHPLTSRKIVIITTHSDHRSMLPKVREVTSRMFNQFINEITENQTIPFVAGGDLNIFINCEGQEYYDKMRGDKGDYRDKIVYAPKEIQNSTFLGLPADAYNAKIDPDGNVEPNAFDHIFYSKDHLDLQFAVRDAAVIDEAGKIIRPENRADYVDALKNRQTASDHFANIVVMKVKSPLEND